MRHKFDGFVAKRMGDQMKRNLLLLPVLAAILFLSGATGDVAQASNAVPANYHQLVARRLVADINWKIQRIRVSRPYQEWMGVFNGTRPVVCAEVIRDSLFGPGSRDLYLLSFQDGRVNSSGVLSGAIYTTRCKPEFAVEVPKGK
jgi:hypothetical protein